MGSDKKEINDQHELRFTDTQREALAEAFGRDVAKKVEAIRLVNIGDSVQSVIVIN